MISNFFVDLLEYYLVSQSLRVDVVFFFSKFYFKLQVNLLLFFMWFFFECFFFVFGFFFTRFSIGSLPSFVF